MAITASDVKSLREMTGAGMMACKNALKETDGDLEKAVDYLRKKGLAAAKKKQSRIAAEGYVVSMLEGATATIVEVNCETDFVSKGDEFKGFATEIAAHILKNNPTNVEELLSQTLASKGTTVADAASELTLKCGEKVDIRRFITKTVDGTGGVAAYNHGGKIGTIVSLKTAADVSSNAVFVELLKDLTMHVAAADPRFIREEDIDADFKAREAKVYAEQLKEQGKPEAMIEKIVEGKLRKLASDVCFLNQKFIKDADLTIAKLIANVAKDVGTDISVISFDKLNLGEGIEKKEDNLADEVAKMTGKQ